MFSLIIPNYNRAHFLPKLYEGIEKQTWTDFEVIFCDDGSQDKSEEILRGFCDGDARCRLVTKANEGSPARAKNYAAGFASQKYLVFIDSDDALHPRLLESYANSLAHLGLQSVVTADARVVHTDAFSLSDDLGAAVLGHIEDYLPRLHKRNCVVASGTAVLRDAFVRLGGFTTDPRITIGEDYHLWLRLALEGDFIHLPVPLVYYREHEGNISSDRLRLSKGLLAISEWMAQHGQRTLAYSLLWQGLKTRGVARIRRGHPGGVMDLGFSLWAWVKRRSI